MFPFTSRFLTIFLILTLIVINATGIRTEHSYQFLYYPIWILIGWTILQFRPALARWSKDSFVRFLILGYAAVLTEELIVGLVHAIGGGISIAEVIIQVRQFWAFNLFAFTGFILGFYVLSRRFSFSSQQLFLVAGVWGLIAERILGHLVSNPIPALVLAVPVMYSYFLIIAPAMGNSGSKALNTFSLLIISIAAIFLFSIVPLVAVQKLRTVTPNAFPSCSFIPC